MADRKQYMKDKIYAIISKHTGNVRKAKTLEDLAITATEVIEKLNTLFFSHVVSNRRELLLAFMDWVIEQEGMTTDSKRTKPETFVDDYLKIKENKMRLVTKTSIITTKNEIGNKNINNCY